MTHPILALARANADKFTPEFMAFLPENMHVWDAFEREAFKVIRMGFEHYSARTILHYLRHRTAIEERGSVWKLNNNTSPYLARLWALRYPGHADLFEYRVVKAVLRTRPAANDPFSKEQA